MTPSPSAWMVRPNPKAQATSRLFCFPYAGAGASVFFPWAKALAPSGMEVCIVQLPGRENRIREEPIVSFSSLMGMLTQDPQPFLQIPFYFMGYSMGSLVAFELCRALRRKHWPPPQHIFMAASEAPQLSRVEERLHVLPDSEFIEAVGRRYHGVAQNLLKHPELLELVLPVLKADFELLENYEYQFEAPLECPLTVFGGDKDESVGLPLLESWRQQTDGPFSIKIFHGDHFFLNTARAEILETILLRIQAHPV